MDEDVTSVHITKGLTSSTILDLIEEYPNLEEITCCPSIFNRISKNYIDALNKLLEEHPLLQSLSLTQLIRISDSLPQALRAPIKNNAGGVYIQPPFVF